MISNTQVSRVCLISPQAHSIETRASHLSTFGHALQSSVEKFEREFLLISSDTLPSGPAKKMKRLDSRVTGLKINFSGIRKIARAVGKITRDDDLLHIYEGGTAELVLGVHLLRQNPNLWLVFNFHQAFQWMTTCERNPRFVDTVSELISELGSRAIFLAESKKLAEELTRRLQHTIRVYPVFSAFPDLRKQNEKNPVRKRKVALFMIRNLEQGKFATNFLTSSGNALDLDIRIHAKHKEDLPREIQEFSDLKISCGDLSTEEYSRSFAESDFVVLPYEEPFYAWGSSGKALDAVHHGSVPVVPSSTVIADSIDGALRFQLEDPDSLAKVLNLSEEEFIKHRKRVIQSRIASPKDAAEIGFLDKGFALGERLDALRLEQLSKDLVESAKKSWPERIRSILIRPLENRRKGKE